MALHIQDRETDRLARELSMTTGETITQAVQTALKERLRKVAAMSTPEAEYIARIKEITARVAAMPNLDTRSEDEILGYNEQGLFD